MSSPPDGIPADAPFRGEVFYDGQCPICMRGVARFGGLLARHGFQVEPLQSPGTQERTGRDREALMRDMHLLTADGRVFAGVEAYLHMGDAIGWARPIAWAARLPGLRALAERVYRAVADNRYRLAQSDVAAGSCPVRPICPQCGERRCRGTTPITLAGAAGWIALVAAASAGWAALGPIELMVLLGVLLIVPLGMPLVPLHVGWTLPIAASAVVASFALPAGWPAGLAATPWLLFTLLLAARSLRQWWKQRCPDVSRLARCAAPLYLPVGAAWLAASRAGLTPMGFPEPIVLLTASHFHFAGFAAVLFCGALGGWLDRRDRPVARILYRLGTIAVIVGTPLLAVGFATSVWLKLLASVALTGGLATVCGLALSRIAWLKPTSAATAIAIGVAAICAIVAAMLALIYVTGETQNETWIPIPLMAMSHGLLNGIGFAAFGLMGCRMLRVPSQ